MNEEVKRIVEALRWQFYNSDCSDFEGLKCPSYEACQKSKVVLCNEMMIADLIEKLTAENERLKARCEAAEKEIPKCCIRCKKNHGCEKPMVYAVQAVSGEWCDDFEWRGPQDGETEESLKI